MPGCIHCEIHDLLDSHAQASEAGLAEVAAKVTEVLADLILSAPQADRITLMADVLANLGEFVLEKGTDETAPPGARRH